MRLRVEPNTYHLVMDIAWYGVAFAATSRFLTIYAIRLGASPGQLTLLTALPALALLVTSMSSTWWRRRFPDSVHAIALPSLGMRMTFLLPVFTPLMPHDLQLTWLVLSVTLPALPQGVASVIFWGLLREAVDEHKLKSLFGRRTAALNLTLGASVLFFTLCLEEVTFPHNYQVVFGVAFAASLVSFWHVNRVRSLPELLPPPAQHSLFPPGVWGNRNFHEVSAIILVTHLAFFSVFPLVPLWLVRNLHASDRFLVEFGLIELYAGAGVSLVAAHLMRWLSYRALVSAAMLTTGLAVGIMVCGASLPIALAASALVGGGWTLVSLSVQAMFIQSAPSQATTAYATLFSQVLFLNTALGPFIGNLFLNTGLDLGTVLLVGMGLRVLAGGLIWMWPAVDTRQSRVLLQQGR